MNHRAQRRLLMAYPGLPLGLRRALASTRSLATALMTTPPHSPATVVHDLGLESVTRGHSGVGSAAGSSRRRRVEVGAAESEHLQRQPEVFAGLPDPFHAVAADGCRDTGVSRPDYRTTKISSMWRNALPARARVVLPSRLPSSTRLHVDLV
jgi:hypothetical protein